MPFITKQKINSRLDNNNIEKVTTNNNLGNLSHELNSNDSMQTIDVGWDGWITSGIISEQMWWSANKKRCISKWIENKIWKWKRASYVLFTGSAGS